jgi:hypothetical protein
MRKALLATAMIVSLLFGSPVGAQDFTVTGSLTDSASLPKKGAFTYTGTFELTSGAGTGLTGPVQVSVDFATGNVSADLTIPQIGSGQLGTSPPIPYTPTGVISGKNKKASYDLTQGVSFSQFDPYIALSGSFLGPRAASTTGTFNANFCVPEPDCNSPYVVRSVSGTFTATKGSPPS